MTPITTSAAEPLVLSYDRPEIVPGTSRRSLRNGQKQPLCIVALLIWKCEPNHRITFILLHSVPGEPQDFGMTWQSYMELRCLLGTILNTSSRSPGQAA
jgi:hypothetical protein